MVQLTPSGEVAVFVNGVDQLIPGRSEDECVAYALSLVWHSVQPGESNPYTIQEVSDFAQQQYAIETGDDYNSYGMSLAQLYDCLSRTGLQYQALPIDGNSRSSIRAALSNGCPVLVCAWEHSLYDVGLGDRIPYQWDSTPYNHCIALTGNAPDGNVYVRDTVEVGQAFPPGSQRTYDLGKMSFVSITKVIPSWIGANPMPTVSGVPTGWHDDGKTLTAPNNIVVVHGFRDFVLANQWDASNYPLEAEHGQSPLELSNPSLGNGTQQVFRWTTLEWTSSRGVFVAWVGQELLALRGLMAALQPKISDLSTQIADLQAQVTKLEASQDNAVSQLVKSDLTALLAKLP